MLLRCEELLYTLNVYLVSHINVCSATSIVSMVFDLPISQKDPIITMVGCVLMQEGLRLLMLVPGKEKRKKIFLLFFWKKEPKFSRIKHGKLLVLFFLFLLNVI